MSAYGIIISLSILSSILVLRSLVDKKDEDVMWGVCFWTVLFGILGSTFYHVIDFGHITKLSLLEIFKIWNGGLGIWGGIFGGTLGAYVYKN